MINLEVDCILLLVFLISDKSTLIALISHITVGVIITKVYVYVLVALIMKLEKRKKLIVQH
jgi:energy-converting hydrogenase Eha subunit E